ncbi:hypothetical protein HK098_002603 [Nowakowskiella sp. JEL0407]|nr:hypothetical protein HK098_002603 [Nowakowskiella sp. JEL0407]
MSQTTSQPKAAASFPITDEYVAFLNQKLENLPPQKILEWATVSIPNLFQTTAFGLTGLVILDMLSKLAAERAGTPDETVENPIELVFLDTLYHFNETLELAEKVSKKYKTKLHIYKPANSETRADFEKQNGENLWATDKEIYDYLVKVEPSRRAYAELSIEAVITGRRRSQAGARGSIPVIEIDRTANPPMLKLNPLAAWDFKAVMQYIRSNGVPYNPLLDQGYKSIGDVHSTRPTKEGENERDGRFEGKDDKECGLHKDYLKMRAAYVAAKKRKIALQSVTGSEVLVEQKKEKLDETA